MPTSGRGERECVSRPTGLSTVDLGVVVVGKIRRWSKERMTDCLLWLMVKVKRKTNG